VPPRKKTTPGPPPLTDAEVAALGSRLKAGEKPRVIVRSASAAVPAGTRGNIIRLGNPKDGDYVVVRLGRDEVPFAPAELSLSTRGAAKASSSSVPPAPVQKRIAAATSRPARSATRSTAKATKSAPARAAKAAPPATRQAATQKAAPAAPAKSTTTRAAAGAGPGAGRSTKRGARRGKGRSPQPLMVTLRFSDSRWTVEAQRGSRRITKAMPLLPRAVSAFAEHVDEQVVREALVETVESCRAVVEERAALLRAELQAAESSLREYDARRR
jgi:hypothetical protein